MSAPAGNYRACIPSLPKADLLFGGHMLRCSLVDIARKGALLNKGHSELLRLHLPIRLQVPGIPDSISSLVVFRDGAMVGIKFVALRQNQLVAIERLVMDRAGYPQLLDRDVPDLVRACGPSRSQAIYSGIEN